MTLIKNGFGTYDVPKCLEQIEERITALESENSALRTALIPVTPPPPPPSETGASNETV